MVRLAPDSVLFCAGGVYWGPREIEGGKAVPVPNLVQLQFSRAACLPPSGDDRKDSSSSVPPRDACPRSIFSLQNSKIAQHSSTSLILVPSDEFIVQLFKQPRDATSLQEQWKGGLDLSLASSASSEFH